jgi:hypothetical protein
VFLERDCDWALKLFQETAAKEEGRLQLAGADAVLNALGTLSTIESDDALIENRLAASELTMDVCGRADNEDEQHEEKLRAHVQKALSGADKTLNTRARSKSSLKGVAPRRFKIPILFVLVVIKSRTEPFPCDRVR